MGVYYGDYHGDLAAMEITMGIYYGDYHGDLLWRLPWGFTMEITIGIYYGDYHGDLLWKLPWGFTIAGYFNSRSAFKCIQ